MKRHLKALLSEILQPKELHHIYNSYDIVGDIAIIRLTEKSKQYGKIIAETVMKVHKNVKVVLAQTGPVCGEYRLRKLEHIAGENRTTTIHKESGCLFAVDVDKCYFSPRLFYERMRIAKLVKNGETILNMFAGIGCFSLVIAKHSNAAKIYSIDINPIALQYMKENIKLNRAFGRIVPVMGDAKEIIQKRLKGTSDRVLMPLPEKAFEYLPIAILALKGGGWIHYYAFEHAKKGEKVVEKVKRKVARKFKELGIRFAIPFCRIIRTTGPNWYQIALDVKIYADCNTKV